jgi:hypothetical protein
MTASRSRECPARPPRLSPTQVRADALRANGYTERNKLCQEHDVIVPRMRSKGGTLNPEDRDLNHQISNVRMNAENVTCRQRTVRIRRALDLNDTRRYSLF